jgi:peptide/nickel transport system substrate-binding protein
VRVLAITDPNTTVANLLAGTVHIAVDQAMKDQQAVAVEEQWRPTNGGTVVRSPVTIRAAHFQMRPEFPNPAGSDLRIRQAIAHATDRQAIGDAVTSGGGKIAEILLLPQSEYYADAYRATPKFPLDLQRSAQLMADVGYQKDADGFFAGPNGRFAIEVAVTDSNPTEGTVFADVLRQAGFQTSLRVIPRAQQSEPLIFANFSGLFDGAVNSTYIPNVEHFRATSIARAETRYLGDNYAGFNDPDFERLATAWDASLDRGQRRQLAVQLIQRLGDALPAFGLYCALYTMTHVSSLRGPMETATSSNGGWNIHEWEWTS